MFALFCVCESEAETDVHFILICQKYADIIEQYIRRKYFNNPSSFELSALFATATRPQVHWLRLAVYSMKAFTILWLLLATYSMIAFTFLFCLFVTSFRFQA